MTWQERFWSYIDRRSDDECWPWLRARHPSGYGSFGRTEPRRTGVSHRISWELAHGPIPTGMDVCHHCDNPPCCNPKHLFLGTPRDNAADMRDV